MNRRRFVTYTAAVCALIIFALLLGWWQVDGRGSTGSVGKLPLSLDQMNFQMTDQDHETVSPAILLGKPSMVFFGFTYCPDICPTTLANISSWVDDLGRAAANLNVVFITVDPERDTTEVMTKYVSFFHPSIQGWTGSNSQTRQAAEDFRASYEKVATGGGDYTMNHSASVFLFDAKGQFSGTIDYHEPKEYAAPKIRRLLETYTQETSEIEKIGRKN